MPEAYAMPGRTEPRRRFGNEYSFERIRTPGAETDHERVVVVDDFARQHVGVVDPDRLDVDRAVIRSFLETTAPIEGESPGSCSCLRW